jgi:hypothetical protein
LALGADDKVGEQQGGVGMGRVGDDGRSTGVCHSHVQGHPVDGRALFFHDNHLVPENRWRSGDFSGDQQVEKTEARELEQPDFLVFEFFHEAVALVFQHRPDNSGTRTLGGHGEFALELRP